MLSGPASPVPWPGGSSGLLGSSGSTGLLGSVPGVKVTVAFEVTVETVAANTGHEKQSSEKPQAHKNAIKDLFFIINFYRHVVIIICLIMALISQYAKSWFLR